VCRRWEEAQPGSQPKVANRNVPYHGRHAQFINGDLLDGRKLLFFQEFKLLCEFGLSSVIP